MKNIILVICALALAGCDTHVKVTSIDSALTASTNAEHVILYSGTNNLAEWMSAGPVQASAGVVQFTDAKTGLHITLTGTMISFRK